MTNIEKKINTHREIKCPKHRVKLEKERVLLLFKQFFIGESIAYGILKRNSNLPEILEFVR